MTHRFSRKTSVLMAALFIGTVAGSAALCQGPPPGGPGFPGGPGGPGGPGFGRGPMGGPRQASAVQAPLSALVAGLKLTDDQKTQIQTIQDQIKQQRDALRPQPGQGNDGPPDPETMRANFDKLRAKETQADKDIKAVLTDTQQKALPGLLKQLDNLHVAGIPAELYGTLNLTDDQQSRIAAIAKKARAAMPGPGQRGPDGGQGGDPRAAMRKVHDQAMAVLTEDQQQQVKSWMDAHPRPNFGGGHGGPGGPGGPGGDGPPPPNGDGGAPPPPGA